ncbi:hypothetical protein [Clostridium thailandense]|uniref:Uncharacterized protein n=1 Tax=Clostridium thailandense TaxID=2794346 RepID=A0A949TQM9_9CLOT|nr:hypothetical protein [Clostridium thailandense]MBV7273627.1 hypothetical protein [Clostridium thailandense]MCH5136299.1 hypothetical protein [Clostridiaceae bacterium UIB06]
MNAELQQVEKFLNQYGMTLGRNKKTTNSLLRQLTRQNIIARSMRCVYKIDNFIIKASSDATSFRLPIGADQCLNEFDIYTSDDERLQEFKEILCPVYALYESKFIYLTVHKLLTPLDTSTESTETIYTHLEKGFSFSNVDSFFPLLEKFKKTWVSDSPELQNEYCKINSFGYDEKNNLYLLDYGML